MRIDQRIGRIDRWGQTSEAVAIYNLITADTIDADIYERCLLRIGVFERALGANEAILGSITRELTSVAKSLALSSAERKAKLDQLADNSIRLVREQQDLEVRQTELFGLHVPGDQFRRDVEDAASYWLSAASLERLVSIYLRDYVPYTYLVDVLQRIDRHPAQRVVELTPRVWMKRFADNPLRSDVDRVRDSPPAN